MVAMPEFVNRFRSWSIKSSSQARRQPGKAASNAVVACPRLP